MEQDSQLADVLGRYVHRSGYSLGQLNRLSGVPKRTIANWLDGRIRHPRASGDILRLAAVLHLNAAQTTEVLRSAGYPAISELLAAARPGEEQTLLAPWIATAEVPAAEVQAARPPFQVIADLPYFVGREREMEAIQAVLLNGSQLKVCSLHGMGGVGKTSLAARLAYRLRPHFPDGVLWARLDTSDTMSILSTFAGAYGKDVSPYTDLAGRSQAVRDLLAHKQALIVLDNVQHSEEVKPLLPPTGSCSVLMTTRRHDLSVMRGIRRFHLSEFGNDGREAIALFAYILGELQTQAERETLTQIAELVGHLPLAIAIIASRMAYEPGWLTAEFLQRLQREKGRLNELAYDDQSVRLSFNMNYQVLPAEQRSLFAALAAFEGDDFAPEAAAFLVGLPLESAEDHLRKLFALSLVQQDRPGRYHLHPLLSEYARETLHDKQTAGQMVAYYLDYVEANQKDFEALERESNHIKRALRLAEQQRMEPELVRGVLAFYRFLQVRGLYAEAEKWLLLAYRAAQQQDDLVGQVKILHYLGQIKEKRGEFNRAQEYLQTGLAIGREAGDDPSICAILTNLGVLAAKGGNFIQAESYLREGLTLAHQLGDSEKTSGLLSNLGGVAACLGDYAGAQAYFEQGLTLARKADHDERIISLVANLGVVTDKQGHYNQAEAYYKEGLGLARKIGHRSYIISLVQNLGEIAARKQDYGRAKAFYEEGLALACKIGHSESIGFLLACLGEVFGECGDYQQAEAYLQEGLCLARQIGQYMHTSIMLNKLGEIHLRQHNLVQAEAAYSEARAMAEQTGFKEPATIALYGLARVAAAAGEGYAAHQQGQESLLAFQELGHHKAAEVQAWLYTLANVA